MGVSIDDTNDINLNSWMIWNGKSVFNMDDIGVPHSRKPPNMFGWHNHETKSSVLNVSVPMFSN